MTVMVTFELAQCVARLIIIPSLWHRNQCWGNQTNDQQYHWHHRWYQSQWKQKQKRIVSSTLSIWEPQCQDIESTSPHGTNHQERQGRLTGSQDQFHELSGHVNIPVCESWTLIAELALKSNPKLNTTKNYYISHVESMLPMKKSRTQSNWSLVPFEDILTTGKPRKQIWYGHVFRASGLT